MRREIDFVKMNPTQNMSILKFVAVYDGRQLPGQAGKPGKERYGNTRNCENHGFRLSDYRGGVSYHLSGTGGTFTPN